MAQLRDAKTSELIAEGTPLEVAVIADELGRAEVLFDDVGPGFDPDAVLRAHAENVAGLERAAKEARGDTRTDLAAAVKRERETETKARGRAASASRNLDRARARLDG